MKLLHVVSVWIYTAFPGISALKPSRFPVSSVAYSAESGDSVTVLSVTFAIDNPLSQTSGESAFVLLWFPDSFTPVGEAPTADICNARFGQFGVDTVSACVTRFSGLTDTLLTLNSSSLVDHATVLSPVVAFVGNPASVMYGSVVMQITTSLAAMTPIKASLCCMQLPEQMEADSNSILISILKQTPSGVFEPLINPGPVQFSPRVLLLNQWTQLELQFSPPVPLSHSVMTFTIQPGVVIPADSFIVFALPGVVLDSSLNAEEVEFTVNVSGAGANLLDYYAVWNASSSELIFRFATAMNFETVANISTLYSNFILPASSEQNNPNFTATVYLSGDSNAFIATTSFYQSETILPAINFVFSAFTPTNFSFALNRAVTALTLYLPGYSSADLLVSVTQPAEASGFFDAATSLLIFNFSIPLGLAPTSVLFTGLLPPEGQYANDRSVQVSVPGTDFFVPVMFSPAFGIFKEFNSSSLTYDPKVPGTPTNLSIAFQPSVPLFPGTVVEVFLRGGFQRTSSSPQETIVLYGPSAFVFGDTAFWNETSSSLSLEVRQASLLVGSASVWIPGDINGFSLPMMLSENDGILLIRAVSGVFINPQPVSTSPAVGSVAKAITASSIQFSPSDPGSVSTLTISFTCNTDILSGGEITVHLGGFNMTDSPNVIVSGVNAPSFSNQRGDWISDAQNLTLIVASPVVLSAGVAVSFAISSFFALPNALLANDPSLWISIANMGIAKRQFFNASDRVNQQVLKSFSTSEISYGSLGGNLTIHVAATFALLPGSVIAFSLPGFSADAPEMNFSSTPDSILAPLAKWNNQTSCLSFTIASAIQNSAILTINVSNQFVLPPSKAENDPSLTVSVSGSQYLPPEPFKKSPAITPRVFSHSAISYFPSEPLATTMIVINLTASVVIEAGARITVTLGPAFTRLSGNGSVSVSSETQCTAFWNGNILTIELIESVAPLTALSFLIPESELFQLPRALALNSASLTVGVAGSISTAPFQSSPLVGDGPYLGQLYCMYQYESGVRVHVNNEAMYSDINTDCESPAVCAADDWVKDPCSVRELSRCGCQTSSFAAVSPFQVSGFNLNQSDRLFFLDSDAPAECDITRMSLDVQIRSDAAIQLTSNGIAFPAVRALVPGNFTVCLAHNGIKFKIGSLIVRPNCPPPQVSYGGACMDYCPLNFVPHFGQCNQIFSFYPPTKTHVFTVALVYPSADALGLSSLALSDPSVQFFIFSFLQNLLLILDPTLFDLSMFNVTQLSPGAHLINRLTDTVVVRTVIAASGTSAISLLDAYLSDFNSILFANTFFASVYPQVALSASPVQQCPSTGSYSPLCPLTIAVASPTSLPSAYTLGIALGGFFGGIIIAALFLSCYRMESKQRVDRARESKPPMEPSVKENERTNDFSVIKIGNLSSEPTLEMDPAQYARAWLDGRLTDYEQPLTLKRRKI